MPKNVYLVYVTLATGDVCAPFIFLNGQNASAFAKENYPVPTEFPLAIFNNILDGRIYVDSTEDGQFQLLQSEDGVFVEAQPKQLARKNYNGPIAVQIHREEIQDAQ